MNAARAFFDTNVLLYLYGGPVEKQVRAQEVFRLHASEGHLLLSTQVIQEFYVAGAQKLGMSRHALRDAVSALLDCPLVVVGPAQISAAIDKEERYQISFWDALIVAAAESGGADVLYTEDLNDGQRYGVVTVRNPFAIPREPA
jgi:predicted nucleic acid-binding protein